MRSGRARNAVLWLIMPDGAQLRAAGCTVDDKSGEPSEYGSFGWVMDPEGHRIELWQPPEGK